VATQPHPSLLRTAARPLGLLILGLSATMAICASAGLMQDSTEGITEMLWAAIICGVSGIIIQLLGHGVDAKIGRREALFVVAGAWTSCSIFGALPYILGSSMPPIDALFESVSGFTTTGATTLADIEGTLTPPLHMWRMATHWLGGLGIVVLFVALFPELGVGGKHLFRTETPGPRSKGLAPRIRDTAGVLWKVYLGLTLLAFALLALAGMSTFDALAHAFTTLATGGFSTRNGSIAAYDNVVIEGVVTGFMIIGGTNFVLFHAALRRGFKVFWQNLEFRLYLTLFVVISLLITMDIHGTVHASLGDAFRYASFQTAAILTTTGLGTDDFEAWPGLSQALLVMLYFTGGSSGSTAGGMKLIRILIVSKLIFSEMRRAYRPQLVAPVRVGSHVIGPAALLETVAYCLVFGLTILGGGIGLALLEGADLMTSLSASLACVSNMGPAFGGVGPTDNYGWFSPGAKLLMGALMLLGRLEFFALLTLLVPDFWRR